MLEAFRAARDRGVDVRIVMDAKRNQQKDQRTGERHDVPREDNLEAIAAAGIGDLVILRETNKSYIAHNKFIVHVRDGQPAGRLDRLDQRHRRRDLRPLERRPCRARAGGRAGLSSTSGPSLAGDPARAPAPWPTTSSRPVPAAAPPTGITTLFSPRTGLGALEWYASRMDAAKGSVFFTAAFGISGPLRAILAKDVDYLRYGLLDKADGSVELLKRDRDNVFAVGARIEDATSAAGRRSR